jgi:hypothetical protein
VCCLARFEAISRNVDIKMKMDLFGLSIILLIFGKNRILFFSETRNRMHVEPYKISSAVSFVFVKNLYRFYFAVIKSFAAPCGDKGQAVKI